jgi:hypothetical protein
MNRTIRALAAIGMVSIAFQAKLVATPNGKPSKVTVAKPTMTAPAGSKPSKPVKPVSVPVMKTTATGHGSTQIKSAKTAAPKMTSTKPTSKADVKAAKTTTRTAKVAVKADAKLAKSTTRTDAKASKQSSTTTGTATTSGSSSDSTSDGSSTTSGTNSTTDGASTTDPVVVSNPLADKISRNPKLAAKIASRLPSDMTLAQASTGFRNQGQFLAAVNVSNNLGIDFAKLQTAMTGQRVTVDPKTHEIITKATGDAPVSLGRAIQTLKSGVDADAAVQTAQAQTSTMVQSTTSPPTTTSTTTAASRSKGKSKKPRTSH